MRSKLTKIKQNATSHPRIIHPDADLSRRQTNTNNDTSALTTIHDLVYITTLTLGGVQYPVQLDTGSSDLWVKGDTSPLPNSNPTTTAKNLTYGIGWASGKISYAPVEFSEISIKSQVFLDVETANNPALGLGAKGIAGLGFTSLSTLDQAINSTNAATGRSLLYNLFAENPSQPNFISFALQRSLEPGDEVEGTFTIGEYEPEYAEVQNRTLIPTFPEENPAYWNVLLDAIIVGDNIIVPSTTVKGAPVNKGVALMDSGSSYTFAPKEIVDQIYGKINGATFDPSTGLYSVPCGIEIDVAFQINGGIYPMHPLDVTPASATDATKCIGSFVAGNLGVGAGHFDLTVGDNFLRSVYSIYDFGDFDSTGKMGNPYMKMLPLIEPDEASADFHQLRGGTPKTGITYKGLDGAQIQPSYSLSNNANDTLTMLGRFFPAVMAIIFLNALILISVVIGGIVYFWRRRRFTARQRRIPGRTARRQSPMPMNRNTFASDRNTMVGDRNTFVGDRSTFIGDLPSKKTMSYMGGSDDFSSPLASSSMSIKGKDHSYQPVSMAISEDTVFTPPSPAFHSFDARMGDRPKSVA